MILSKEVKIKMSARYLYRYRELGYECNVGDIVLIKIEHLTGSAKVIISAKCDYCDNEKEISYKDYNKILTRSNLFSCSKKCGVLKAKITNLEKYGVENVFQSEKIKDIIIETNLKKYGVSSPMMSKEIREKSKKTCLEKYGHENILQSTEIREVYKKIIFEKYGVEHPMLIQETKEKIKETFLEKYSVEHPMLIQATKDKIKETCLEKYGVEHPFQSNIIKEKIKKSNLEKYGSELYMNSNDFKEKSTKIFLEKYDVINPFQSNIIKEKIKEKNLEKYSKEYFSQSEDNHINTMIGKHSNYIKYLNDSISLFYCNKEHQFEISSDNYHSRTKNNIPLCTVCNPIGDSKSIKEKELFLLIKENYQDEVISSYRDGLEIDIFLPELKIGFEFNGLYWHSNKFKDKNYHLDKTNHFKDKDIRIIHIWEDDYDSKIEIIKSQILNFLKKNKKKIFARKCYIKEIKDAKIARQFLDSNHIQGFVNSSIKIGLYYEDLLVSIMTFDSFEGRKKMEEGGYNLSRFCNLLNTNVVGGASKLLSYFVKNYSPTRIVSYADKDWSIGNLYYTLGFENVGDNGPDYKYIVNSKRVHKSRYKKSKLNTNLTESKQMEKDGFLKIYDCGKIKFETKLIKKI